VPGASNADLDVSRSRRWLRLMDHATGTETLYDLQTDPLAKHDLLTDSALDEDARKEVHVESDALAASFAEWVRASLLVAASQPEPVEVAHP